MALARLAAVFVFAFFVQANASGAEFARNFGGLSAAYVTATGVAVDANGNEFVAGYYYGTTLAIGGSSQGRIGISDAFVAKLDPAGNALWVRTLGGPGARAFGQGVAVDGSGNVYVAGYFNGASLNTPAMALHGNEDAFVAKLDANGMMVWATSFGGSGAWAEGQAVAVDANSHAYLAGQFRGNSLAAPPLNIIGSSDVFVVRLDAAGVPLWSVNLGGSGSQAFGQAVAVDASGNAYVGGYFWGANLTQPALTHIGNFDAFAIKLAATTGAVAWATNFGGAGSHATGSSIAVDGTGVNAYLGGQFFGGNLTKPALAIIGGQDAFAVRIDAASGAAGWAKNFGGSGLQVYADALAVDGTGSPYVGGRVEGSGAMTTPAVPSLGVNDALALKLDATTGGTTWARRYGGAQATVWGTAIAVAGDGAVALGGQFGGPLDAPPLSSPVGGGGFAFRLDSSGNPLWARAFSSSLPGGTASINSTAADGSGNVYFAGTFDANALVIGSFTLSRIGYQDAFAAKLDAAGAVQWARNFGGWGAGTTAQGIAVDVAGGVNVGGTFDSASLTVPPLPIVGHRDAYAAKLNAATGGVTWAKNFGGATAQTYGQGIAADAAGNVYLAGYFGNGDLSQPALAKGGYQDAFAFKLAAANGGTVWAKGFGGALIDYAYGQAVAVDGAGNPYLVGNFLGTLALSPPLHSLGNLDAFALRLDSTGAITWALRIGGPGATADLRAVAADGTGNAYLAGAIGNANLTVPALPIIGGNDAFVIKVDASGAIFWAKNFGGPGAQAFGNGVAVDVAGNVYVGGFDFGARMSTPPLMKIGSDDAFAIKLDSSGKTKWAKNYGGGNAWAHIQSVAVGVNRALFLGGDMRINNLTTPPLTLIGGTDALILGQTYYGLTYDGNGNDSGTVPMDLTAYLSGMVAIVACNTGGLAKAGSVFTGWNTAPNGTGTHYKPGDTLVLINADVTLYAQWGPPGLAPVLHCVYSRKTHDTAGTYDLPL